MLHDLVLGLAARAQVGRARAGIGADARQVDQPRRDLRAAGGVDGELGQAEVDLLRRCRPATASAFAFARVVPIRM